MCVLKKKLFKIAIATLFSMWSLPAFKKKYNHYHRNSVLNLTLTTKSADQAFCIALQWPSSQCPAFTIENKRKRKTSPEKDLKRIIKLKQHINYHECIPSK